MKGFRGEEGREYVEKGTKENKKNHAISPRR
jgi:hypothetical protein